MTSICSCREQIVTCKIMQRNCRRMSKAWVQHAAAFHTNYKIQMGCINSTSIHNPWMRHCCRLWGGFGRTTFEADKKAQLTALWPILFVASDSFRANFKRALSEWCDPPPCIKCEKRKRSTLRATLSSNLFLQQYTRVCKARLACPCCEQRLTNTWVVGSWTVWIC